MDSAMLHNVTSVTIKDKERETVGVNGDYDTQKIVIRKEDGKEIWVTLFFDGKKASEAIRNENQTKHKR